MRTEKALISLLKNLVDLIREEAARNPRFSNQLDSLLAPLPEARKRVKKLKNAAPPVETPDIYAEWRARGEQEFRLWLVDKPVEVMRALIKQHDLDPSHRTSKWKEPEKISAYIADQLRARLSRGAAFMRG